MKRCISSALVIALLCAVILPAVSCSRNDNGQIEAAAMIGASDTSVPTDTAAPAPTDTPAPTDEPQPVFAPRQRPENVTVEWLAEELMYRFYIGWINLELEDFSDIMDRNRETDIFFYTNQYEIDAVRLGINSGIISPGPGTAEVKWIVDETDTEITVHVWIEPNLVWRGETSGGSTEFQITVDKQRMVIIGYDQDMCEGIYCTRLKPLAFEYRVDLPWEEADKKAYDELYADLEKSAEIINGQS
ncbi:MAG: hypothetical protein J5544_06465 [Clostridia bacterium]|nr:hypothetical protein [Clostridia bacterium]